MILIFLNFKNGQKESELKTFSCGGGVGSLCDGRGQHIYCTVGLQGYEIGLHCTSKDCKWGCYVSKVHSEIM